MSVLFRSYKLEWLYNFFELKLNLVGGLTYHVGDGGDDQIALVKRKCYVIIKWAMRPWPKKTLPFMVL